MSDIPMELTVWEGDYGLPSMCPECIYIMLYMKIARVPIKCHFKKNPYWEIGERFPIFKHGKIFTTNVPLILGYLRIKRYGTEFGLSSKQCSQSYAFSNMLENTLKPIVEFVWWVDHRNYEGFTKRWHMRAMPLPVNLLYPGHRRRKAKNLIESLFLQADDYEVIQSFMVNAAEKCFNALSTRLGQYEFFYGYTPTSLDAMVYAYLAPLLKLPFPSSEIPRLLKTYTELVDFVKRLDSEFFPELKPGAKYLKDSSSVNQETTPLSFTGKIITCLCAVCALAVYAACHDIINISKFQHLTTPV